MPADSFTVKMALWQRAWAALLFLSSASSWEVCPDPEGWWVNLDTGELVGRSEWTQGSWLVGLNGLKFTAFGAGWMSRSSRQNTSGVGRFHTHPPSLLLGVH